MTLNNAQEMSVISLEHLVEDLKLWLYETGKDFTPTEYFENIERLAGQISLIANHTKSS